MTYLLAAGLGVALILICYLADGEGWGGLLGVLGFCIVVGTGITSCENSEWNQKMKQEQRERERADAKPRIVREVDGCKVYAFKATPSASHWTFFTRCPDSKTSTESSHNRTVRVGKTTSTVTDTETVEVGK